MRNVCEWQWEHEYVYVHDCVFHFCQLHMCQPWSAVLPGSAWRGKQERMFVCVCVCVAEVAHAHGPEGVGTSSGMGSGRWSRGARCTATWSVGSAWLECRPCEPLGPRNLAPKLSPPHTPPKNTQKLTSVLSVPLPIDRLSFEEVRGQADGPAAWLQKKLMLNHPHRHTPIPAAVGCVLHVWNTHLELGGWICRCRL